MIVNDSAHAMWMETRMRLLERRINRLQQIGWFDHEAERPKRSRRSTLAVLMEASETIWRFVTASRPEAEAGGAR
jgi:hypothetical protein